MRKIFGDLGTMCLGIAAILIASVIISFGMDKGPQLTAVIGAVALLMTGIILRILGGDAGNSSDGR